MRRIMTLLGVLGLALGILAGPAAAQDKPKPPVEAHLLVQPQIQSTEDAAPSGDTWDKDFFLRRARIILKGNVNDWIQFFYETDNPKFGQGGNFDTSLYTQDAYIDFQFYTEFKLAFGMILLPFTHNMRQSAVKLNALDYHDLYKDRLIANKGWRDMGLEARGIVMDKLDYRVGVYNGLHGACEKDAATGEPKVPGCKPANDSDMPRITGRLAYNLFDAEPDFFYTGISFGKKIVQVGAGVDFQPGATWNDKGDKANYLAFSGDLFVDWPLNDEMELVFQVAYLQYDLGYATKDWKTFDEAAGSGKGAYGEVGFRYGIWEPVLGGEWFDAKDDAKDLLSIRGGVNLWIDKFNSNVKLEFANLQTGKDDSEKTIKQVTLQGQIFF